MSDTKLHLGLEAGELSLKVVLFDAENKAIVKAASLDMPVPPLNDIATLETTLQGWLTENSIEEVASISLAASSFRAVVKQIVVPPEVKEIHDYLVWYLSTLINEAPKHYFLDYQVLSEDKEIGTTVLFIALRNEWVDAARKGFRNKKLAPQLMIVDVVSMMNLAEVASETPDGLRCVVKADIAGVSLMWISKDNLRCLRGVSTIDLVGRDQIEAYQILSLGIQEQLNKVKEDCGIETPKFFLCGDVSTDATFSAILRAVLKDTEIVLMDSLPYIKLPADADQAALLPLCVGALGAAVQAAAGEAPAGKEAVV